MMIPGMNQRQMKQMMRKMGMQQTDIPATEVIIRTADKDIVILDPSVAMVKAMGQETFQISGQIQERAKEITIDLDDIKTVASQASVSEEDAKKALEENQGDLAKAILSLTEQ